MEQKNDVVMYVAPGIELALPFDADNETVWATQAQIEELFGIDQSGVSRHIRNVFASAEVDHGSNMQKTHIAPSAKPVALYSLDVILAVGYRANSAEAISFRRWANGVLKSYLVRGVAIDERRLEDLGLLVEIASRADDDLVSGVAEVLIRYLPGLHLLREYDDGVIASSPGHQPDWLLSVLEARSVIREVADAFPADTLFGLERSHALEGIIHTLYSGIGGFEQYPTVEEKAANLLNLVGKDQPLVDGNKRTAAALFVTFRERNGLLRETGGHVTISPNELAAVTLLVATSRPQEKDLMIALVVRILSPGTDSSGATH